MPAAAFLARKWLLLAAILAIVGCEFPHYEFPANGGKQDASSDGIAPNGDGDGDGDGGAVRECGSATDCADASDGAFCDLAKGKCVQCMGAADCAPAFLCNDGKCVNCLNDMDCRPGLDGAAAQTGADSAVESGGGGRVTCGPLSHLCTGCAVDTDCPFGTVCNPVSQFCIAGCSIAQRCPDGFVCCDKQCIGTDRKCQPICPTGYDDCNRIDADGCESKLNTPEHCGNCDTDCTIPNRATACEANACMVGECLYGFKDCDTWQSTGCEVNWTSDPDNCGDCKVRCDNPHGRRGCDMGVCAPTCDLGFGVCGNDPTFGCTVDFSSDLQHCGSCDHACRGGGTCVDGKCVGCPDAQPVVDSPCTDPNLMCGPYSGSGDTACLCFCVNNRITCRIKQKDGNGCNVTQ